MAPWWECTSLDITYSLLKEGEIRLIEFEPVASLEPTGSPGFRVQHVLLDNAPPYCALSYRWPNGKEVEEPEKFKGLWLDISGGPLVAIRAYLDLQDQKDQKDRHFRFWIDQFCIQQSDLDEMNHQVPKMGAIFSKASTAIIFLGVPRGPKCEEYFSNAFKLFSEFLDQANTSGMPNAGIKKTTLRPIMQKQSVGTISALVTILSAPWFTRTWVVQEASLSHDPMVLCGSDEFRNTGHDNKRLHEDFTILCSFLEDLDEIGFLRTIFRDFHTPENPWQPKVHTARLFYNLKITSWMGAEKNASLSCSKVNGTKNLLRLCRPLKATDPRDKIFAMGALCRQEEMPDVDYNAAEAQVYREMAVKLLTKDHPTCPLPSSCAWNALGVLALVNSDPDAVRRPSWIPDWTLPLTYNDLWWDYADHNSGKMAAAGGRTQSLRFSAEVPRGLVLRGKVCARVASTGEGSVLTGVFGHGYVEEGRPDEEWWPLSRGFGESRKARSLDEWILRAGEYLRRRLEDGPLREGRIARTLCANIDFGETSRHVAKGARDGFSTFANAWEAYKIYTQHIFDEESNVQEAADLSKYEPRFKDFRAGAGLACRGRRLFATDDGHVGIGPGRIKEGDVISIIYGAGWPFVLRPHGNNFLLVGYCYVDEIMNGEMVDNVDIPERDICLV